jgi:N-methylhydantoinase A
VEEAAAGIVEIIDNAMARAIRTVSVGRGHDPRRFALVAFGGAGPLHACRLAELLDIPMVVVPPRPGVLSTWGMLDTDIRATFVRTVGTAQRHMGDGGAGVPTLDAVWAELEAQARVWLEGEQVPRAQMRFERAADLRYEHQSFELTCPLGEGPLTPERLSALVSTFHAEHRRLYTYDLPNAPIELVTLRVTAIGALPKRAAPAPESLAPGGGRVAVRAETLASSGEARAEMIRRGDRMVYFRGRGFMNTPIYPREGLTPGTSFDGPAIIEQSDATPLVAPGFRARVDEAYNLLLERA